MDIEAVGVDAESCALATVMFACATTTPAETKAYGVFRPRSDKVSTRSWPGETLNVCWTGAARVVGVTTWLIPMGSVSAACAMVPRKRVMVSTASRKLDIISLEMFLVDAACVGWYP